MIHNYHLWVLLYAKSHFPNKSDKHSVARHQALNKRKEQDIIEMPWTLGFAELFLSPISTTASCMILYKPLQII